MNTLQKLSVAASITILALGVSAGSAHAIALTTDGNWATFSFGSTSSTATPDFQFTIGSGLEGTLDVTDYQFGGDIFEVFNNTTSLGKTSFVPSTFGNPYASTPDEGFANKDFFSSGSFLLGSGSYNIIVKAFDSPYGGGNGALRVNTSSARPVPVPRAIFGVIVAGGALMARQRKNAKAMQPVA